jgi:parallel beta-helix repeat protein
MIVVFFPDGQIWRVDERRIARMKRVGLLLVCLLVSLPVLACHLPTPVPTPTNTPRPTRTPKPTNTVTPTPTATLTPTPTPTPSIVRVEADGSGDYATLEEAIENTPERVPIALGVGTFELEESLNIRNPVRLTGAGMDETRIVSVAEDYAVRFIGQGPFVIEDVAFVHEGRSVADVVVVRGGEATFTRCRFSGGIRSEEEEMENVLGAGLRLEDSTTGTVQDCESMDNDFGFFVLGRAKPDLERNVLSDNDISGIHYWDSTGGTAIENDCSWNVVGIAVGSRAEPTLEGNTCTSNAYDGIIYLGYKGGFARDNTCSDNGRNGILAGVQAQPILEDNVCQGNAQAGIAFIEESEGVARENECFENWVGIYVEVDADPDLVDNDCYDNLEADVVDER